MAKFDTLTDKFNTSATNTILWSSFATGTSTISQAGGVVLCTPPNLAVGSSYAGYTTATTYDLTGSYVFVQINQLVNQVTGEQQYLKVQLDANNHYDIIQENGTISFNQTVGAVPTTLATTPWDSTNTIWWRIRESGGTVFFDTSGDSKYWTNRTTTPTSNFAVTALSGEFAAGTYLSVAASPGKFDNFNSFLDGGTTTSTSSTSSTTFSTSSTSSSTSISSTSFSSTSTSVSTSSTSFSTSSTSSSISSTSSSTSSTSTSSTSSSTSISSTSSSISSTSQSSTSQSSTSKSISISSTSSSFSSTSSSQSSTSRSTSSTSVSSTSSSSSTSTTAIPLNFDYTYQDTLTLPTTGADDIDIDTNKNIQNVAIDDGDYFVQYGSEYVIQEYKKKWTNNTDTPSFTYKGRSTESTITSPILIQIYNQNPTAPSTYYFNASDAGPTDPDAAWVNDANAFNGNTTDGASSSSLGTTSSKYLQGDGTDASTSGGRITQVRARIYGNPNSSGQVVSAAIYTDGLGELLGTPVTGTSVTAAWGNYTTLTAPSTEWTWQKVNDLEVKIYAPGGVTPGGQARRVEIEVTLDAWETLATVNKIPADTDFTITVTQPTNVANYYDSNNIVTFRTYQKVI